MDKLILDATCGSRMIWFDKSDPRALFVDRRVEDGTAIWTSHNGLSERRLDVHPDLIADFTNLPFPSDTFVHVVFDPPHFTKDGFGETGWLAKKYGTLPCDWRPVIRDGFCECWRVLKPYGTLIFKWSEVVISVREIIDILPEKPLYGCRSGKRSKTHWMAFVKLPGENA